MSDPAHSPQAEPDLHSPYLAPLQAAVERLYNVFGTGPLSQALESCACPVCMTEDTRQQIIATPTRDLSSDLIAEYSNSAHGVPQNLDDLRALLPRYLDLIAQDEMVDQTGVGAELTRFADAARMNDSFYTPEQQNALNNWARFLLLHFGYAEATEQDNLGSPAYLLEMLLAGGWRVEVVTSVMDDLFADPEIGQRALAQFASMASRAIEEIPSGARLDWFALRYADDAARAGLADWLNSRSLQIHLSNIAADPETPETALTAVDTLLKASGQFIAEAFIEDDTA